MLHPWLVVTTNPASTAQDPRCSQLQPCPAMFSGAHLPPQPGTSVGTRPHRSQLPSTGAPSRADPNCPAGQNRTALLSVSWCSFEFTLTKALCLEVLFRLGLYIEPSFQPGHKQSSGPTGGRISICDQTRLPAALWAAWKGKAIDLL